MRRTVGCLLALLLYGRQALSAQTDADVAMRFFAAGGAYCVRLAPEGVSLADETEWTIVVLTGTQNTQNVFRIRTADPGTSGARGADLTALGLAAARVWRMDRSRTEFLERFTAGLAAKQVRARMVRFAPPKLAEMTARQRADNYLAFADRGSKVSFSKVPDLSAEEFARFVTYVND